MMRSLSDAGASAEMNGAGVGFDGAPNNKIAAGRGRSVVVESGSI